MAVPFGFSVGDFIALINVVKDVGVALKETGGASSDYQEVARQLETLVSILQEVQSLKATKTDLHLINAIRGQAQLSQETLITFQQKINKYDKNLGRHARQAFHWGTMSKAKWATMVEGDMAHLRQRIDSQMTSLNILLQLQNLNQHNLTQEEFAKSQEAICMAIQSGQSGQASAHAQLQQDIAASANANSTKLSHLETQLENFAQSFRATQAYGTSVLSQRLSQEVTVNSQAFRQALETSLGPTESQLKELSRKLDDHDLSLTRHSVIREPSQGRPTPRALPDSSVHEIRAAVEQLAREPTGLEDIDWEYARTIAAVILFAASQRIISILRDVQILLQNLVCVCPQLLLFLRTFHVLAKPPSRLLGDNIHFEDVLGRLHSLPFQYFQHRDVFLEALKCSFSGYPGVDRIANGEFKILDHRVRSLTAENWKDCAVPGAHLTMSVEVGYIQLEQQCCPSRGCDGQLKAGSPSTSVCTICKKMYLTQDDVQEAQVTAQPVTEDMPTTSTSFALSQMLYQKRLNLPDNLVRSASHDYFHEFRRAVAKDFIGFCSKIITGIEELRDDLEKYNDFEGRLTVNEHTIDEDQHENVDNFIDTMIRLPTDAEKESSWKIIAQDLSLQMLDWPSARVTNSRGYAENARRRELMHQESEAKRRQQNLDLEREEICAYRRVQIGATRPGNNFSEAIVSGDIARVAQILPTDAKINELNANGFSPLTLAVISGNSMLVDLLLESGANPLIASCDQDQCDNALYAAALSGNTSILLSLLSALDCFYPHLLEKSPDRKRRTKIIDRAFRVAVRENQQLAVALMLYFGFRPFYTGTSSEESAYEAALGQGRYNIVASFLVLARGRNMLDLHETREILSAIVEGSIYSLRDSSKELFVQTRKVLTTKAQAATRSGSLLDFLTNSSGSLQAFAQQAPVVVVGSLKNRNERILDLESGLVEALTDIRRYFVGYVTKSLPMIHHVIRLLDRALIAVYQVRGKRSASQDITDFLLAELFGSELNALIENMKLLTFAVNSDLGRPEKLVLDGAAYWRLQTSGFVETCAILTDLKHLMRDLRKDLMPFLIDLNRTARQNAPETYAYCFGGTRRLSPTKRMHVGMALIYAPTSATTTGMEKNKPHLIAIAEPKITFDGSQESAEPDLEAAQDVFSDMSKRAILRAAFKKPQRKPQLHPLVPQTHRRRTSKCYS